MYFHVSYGVSDDCVNPDSYGEICVKCSQCGRTFDGGIMTSGHELGIDEDKFNQLWEEAECDSDSTTD